MNRETYASFLKEKGLVPLLEIRNSLDKDGELIANKKGEKKWVKHPNTVKDWHPIEKWKWDPADLIEIGNRNITGYSIRTGKCSNLLVIDIDIGKDKNGMENFQKWIEDTCTPEEIKNINNTLSVTTGSGGKHYYFKYDYAEKISISASKLAKNIDIRAEGGCILAPGSISEYKDEQGNRKRYTVDDKTKSVQALPKSIERALINLSTKKSKGEKRNIEPKDIDVTSIKKFAEGNRNDSLMRELSRYVNNPKNRNFDTLFFLAVGINAIKCNPPLELEEVKNITSSVLSRYALPPFYDEKGNVIPSVLASTIVGNTNYKQFQKTDYVYNGNFYEEIKEEESIQNLVYNMLPQEKQRVRTLNEVVSLMRVSNTITEKSIQGQNIINMKSGLLNLDTFEIMEHSPKYFTTAQIPCHYPNSKKYEGSKFQQYITSTFWEGAEPLIQEVLGVGLLPNPKKMQKCIFLLGEGSNGKSVFINLIKALHGDNTSSVALKDIDGNRFTLASMMGFNVNIDADASGVRLEDTTNFKKITAGDTVYLERKGKQGISGILNNVMYVGLNKMPSTSDKSYGFIRRNIIVPFNVEFVEKEELDERRKSGKKVVLKDKNLENEILKNEMDIVFNFALEGLKRMIDNEYKFTQSKIVAMKTDEYKQEINSAYAFYVDHCNGMYVYDEVPAKIIYEKYIAWCEDNEISNPVTSTGFGSEFAKHYQKKRVSKGVMYYNVTLNIDITNDIRNKI